MARSIRWRLQAWYALVLVCVVAGFAGILYYQERAARLREIDAGLEAAAQYLDAILRRMPPRELSGPAPDEPPPPPPPPPPPGPRARERPGRPPGPPPPRPSRERLLADLDLPTRPGPAAAAYFAVWREDGSLLKTHDLPEGHPPPDLAGPPPPPRPHFAWRGEAREVALRGPRDTRILAGRPVARELADLRAFAWQLAAAGAGVLVVGLAGGWLISARILRPVAAIAKTASTISATNLSGRIDAGQVDRELEELARVLNAMFDRLEAAFERQARFTADASHELRTPLAVIRSHAELALARPRSADEYREALCACVQAAGRMTALVEGLLTLARADAGRLQLRSAPVDLGRVVEETCGLVAPLADQRDVRLSADLTPVEVHGDADRLAQVATNLLTNAIVYNRPGGDVAVTLAAEDGTAVLTVRDTGVGIPDADQPHVFERFYRVDKARSRERGGSGLGLAICKSIVEAHGGTLTFTSRPDQGTAFAVRLPRGQGR